MGAVFFTERRQQIVVGQTEAETLPQQENECEFDRNTETWD